MTSNQGTVETTGDARKPWITPMVIVAEEAKNSAGTTVPTTIETPDDNLGPS